MSQKEFSIREYQNKDLQGVLDLWEHHSGWGRPEPEEYKKWMKTPFGDCIVIVAEDLKEQVVAQLVLTPTELIIYGENQKALKLSAPIIHEDYRRSDVLNMETLLIQIFLKSYQIVEEKDFNWLYCFPAAFWTKIMGLTNRFGLGPWKSIFYECFEIIDNNTRNSELDLQILNKFPTKISVIYEQFKVLNKNKSFVTRDLKWLKYKWDGDLIVGIYNSIGKIRGYTVIKQQNGLILDFVLLDTEEIPAVLTKLKHLFDKKCEQANILNPGLKFMKTLFISKIIGDIETKPVNFQFLFGLSALKDFSETEKINFDDWYVFPND